MTTESIQLEGGKYTIVHDAGKLIAMRHDEEWRDMSGDKMTYLLFAEVQRLRAVVAQVHSWAVCAAITTPEDMAQNFPEIVEATDPKHQL